MSKVLVTENYLTQTANAIRDKLGVTTKYTPAEFAQAIASISSGIDTSDATAIAELIVNEYTAYVDGEKVIGTMPDNSEISSQTITTKTQEVSIPHGYYPEDIGVSIDSNEQAKIIAGNIKSGVTILGQAGSLTPWSFTWAGSTQQSSSSSQNFSLSKTYTATTNCLVVGVAMSAGDGTKSATITTTGTSLLDSNPSSTIKLKLCKLTSGQNVVVKATGTKGTTMTSEPLGYVRCIVITAS